MMRQSQRAQRGAYQDITQYQTGLVEDSIGTWVEDIAKNSGSKGLSMSAFKAVSDDMAYNDRNLQAEMKSNDIFESVETLRDLYKDSNIADKFNMSRVNPSQIRAAMNKYLNTTGKLQATEAELERRSMPMPRHAGEHMASAPMAEQEAFTPSAPSGNQQIPNLISFLFAPSEDSVARAAIQNTRPISKNLYQAAENNDLKAIDRFLAAPYRHVNERFIMNRSNLTALHGAAEKNNVAAIELLVEQGANLDAQGFHTLSNGTKIEGTTPLHEAAMHNSADAINVLAAQGANLHVQRTSTFLDGTKVEGTTPLHEAAMHNSADAINVLAAQGANLDAQSTAIKLDGTKFERITPLHEAATKNNADAINALAAQGANLHPQRTAIKLDGTKKERITPLHDAARHNSADAINALAAQGANLNVDDKWAATPLHAAIGHNNIESAVAIKKAGGKFSEEKTAAGIDQLNRMLATTIEQGGLRDKNKLRDLFFIGAEMPSLEDRGIAFRTAIKEIQKEANEIEITNPTQTQNRQRSPFAQAESQRRQVNRQQAECCVIM